MASLLNHTIAGKRVGVVYLGTTIFCLAIGIVLWLLGAAEPLWASLVISFCIGYGINTASLLLTPTLERWLRPHPAALLATLTGLFFGLVAAGLLTTGQLLFFITEEYRNVLILGLFFGAIGITFFATSERMHVAESKLIELQAKQLRHEKQQLETQLRLLQAQIEPHFLFNTLSTVISMIRDHPDDAEQMLLHLTTLFRASLSRTRSEQIRLKEELEIVTALLEISRIRMGERLRYRIELDDSLLELPLPPLLLQPLVENAIKHGIEPAEAGGEIVLSITQHENNLIVEVSDTGHDTSQSADSAGTGTGVANIQARLAALFGADASLHLAPRSPSGMLATLTLPAGQS